MSSDSEGQVVEVNLALKRKTISSNHKAIRRVMKKLRSIQDARQPMLTSLQALQVQEDELASLYKRARRCQAVLTDEELDADLQALDEEGWKPAWKKPPTYARSW